MFFSDYQDQESEDAKTYLEAASANDAVPFAITSEQEVFDASKVEKDGIVLFKNFDDKRNELTEGITVDSIAEFVAGNQLPLLIEFTQDVGGIYLGIAIQPIILYARLLYIMLLISLCFNTSNTSWFINGSLPQTSRFSDF